MKNARKDGKNKAECMRIQLEPAKYNDYIVKVKEKFSYTYYFVKFATFYENNFNLLPLWRKQNILFSAMQSAIL